MFTIQGQQCTIKKSKKHLKKKPIQISLFLNKQSPRFQEKPRFRSTLHSQDFSKFVYLDKPLTQESAPLSSSVILKSKHPSRTPTPNKNLSLKINYLNYEFDPPKLPMSRGLLIHVSERETQRSSCSKNRNRFRYEEESARFTEREYKDKITMKDLNLNLPSIIKSKRVKKKCKYRPSLGDSLQFY